MNHKQILNKYIVERTNIKILESNLNIIADRFIKLNEDAIRENRIDELVPLLAAPLWAAAKFAGGQLLRHGATRLAGAALKRGASQLGKRALSGASQLGQRALSGARKGWSMLRGTGGGVRTVGKEVAADTAADAAVQKIMPPKKEKPKNYLADLVASDKSNRGSNLSDDEMVESFLFEALESIFEEKKPGLFRRMISGAGRLGKGILGGFASGFMKGAFGAEPSEKGGFLSRVAKNKEALDRVKRIRQIRQDRERAEKVRADDVKFDKQQRAEKEKQRVSQGLAAQANAAPTPTATPSPTPNQDSVAAKRMERAARGKANTQRAATGNWLSDPLQLDKPKDSDFNPSLLPSNQSNLIAPKNLPKSLPKSGDVKLPRKKTPRKPEVKVIPKGQFGEGVPMNSSLIIMGQKIVESMLMRIQEEDDDDDNIGSKKRKEALGSRRAGFYTKASARKKAEPLLKKNKGGEAYKALLQDPKKQISAIPLNPRRGQGRKGRRSSDPSNRPDSLRGRFVNTSRGRTTDEEKAHQAALEAQKKKRRKALVAKAIAMRSKK